MAKVKVPTPPEVIATIYAQWKPTLGKWMSTRSTGGARVTTASDRISARVTFTLPKGRGFVPIITPVSQTSQGVLYIRDAGSTAKPAFEVCSMTQVAPVGRKAPKLRPLAFMAVVVAIGEPARQSKPAGKPRRKPRG